MRETLACVVVIVLAAGLVVWWVRTEPNDPAVPPVATLQGDRHIFRPETGRKMSQSPACGAPAPGVRSHPLLEEADEVLLAEGGHELRSTADAGLAELIRAVARSGREGRGLALLKIDYPLNNSVFPPEIVPPTVLWHDDVDEVDTWLFDVAFGESREHVYVLSPGNPPPVGPIDPTCVAETNEVYRPTPYQASAKAWTVDSQVWAAIKQRSGGRAVSVTILGFSSADPHTARSQGRINITVSEHPVGAPIFYRDVPLAPSKTEKGVIKPLSDLALPLIAWRLRDISKPESRLLLTGMLSCANCHSFSADGKTLGMDLDGPSGDRGAYVIAPVAAETVIDEKHVISWNSYKNKPKDHKTIGFLSRLSPDGQYAVTTLNEAVYVQNFTDYKFLQVFYPTRGILGYFSRATGEIKALPGADDPAYVHCDPVWTPDGEHLVFARAGAKAPYPQGYKPATHANDPAEPQVQYDLYRMPFNGGRGGKPEPVAGASRNGMSNTFPKVSPDGKWIVFVKCRNGQLMRPDSELWIVPAAGGAARRMSCNTWRMNSWHSFSPNGRWLVFSSKANTPYTQMFLTHLDEHGNDSPAILIPNSTAANRAVNLPEFVNVSYDQFANISVPAMEHRRLGLRGIQLFEKGMLDEAMKQFDAAARSRPDYMEAHVSAAVILIEQGMFDEAIDRLQKLLEIDPECWFAHFNLGVVLAKKGMFDEAIVHLERALELKPDQAEAHANLGGAFMQKGMLEEATVHLRAAVRLAPEHAANRFNLGSVLLEGGLIEEAVAQFEKALELDPRLIHARLALGNALAARGEYESAVDQFRKAREIAPGNLDAINDLAWLLATCRKDEVRDGAMAVQLAEAACKATRHKDAVLMETLAAAYAELGRWPDAIATATSALDLVESHDNHLAREIRQHLERYREGKPLRWPQGVE